MRSAGFFYRVSESKAILNYFPAETQGRREKFVEWDIMTFSASPRLRARLYLNQRQHRLFSRRSRPACEILLTRDSRNGGRRDAEKNLLDGFYLRSLREMYLILALLVQSDSFCNFEGLSESILKRLQNRAETYNALSESVQEAIVLTRNIFTTYCYSTKYKYGISVA